MYQCPETVWDKQNGSIDAAGVQVLVKTKVGWEEIEEG
jgi:hypothetical protein